MRHVFWVIVLGMVLVLSAAPSASQPADPITVEDYLDVLTTHPAPLTSLEARIISSEVNNRFGDTLHTLSSDLIRQGLSALFNTDSGSIGLWYPDLWEKALLLAVLRENEIVLSDGAVITFDDYNLRVSAADFNGDGQPEWVVDIIRDCLLDGGCRYSSSSRSGAFYIDFVVIAGNTPANYRVVDTPLQWSSLRYIGTYRRDTAQSVRFEDINGDGITEWLVIYTTLEKYGNIVRLFVLGWRDGALLDLAADPIEHFESDYEPDSYRSADARPNRWTFGEDGVITQRVNMTDNWRCVREETTEYRWDGTLFQPSPNEVTFPDTSECWMRQAEAAAYDYDFETSIGYYEQALVSPEPAEYAPYIEIRLALAYALNGDLDRAVELLRDLKSNQENEMWWLADAILPDSLNTPTVEQLCFNAYNYVIDQPLAVINTYYNIQPGRIDDYLRVDMYPPINPPGNLGCDVVALLDRQLDAQPLTTDAPPAQQLEQRSWRIGETFQADFNGDSVDDWMVWLDSEMVQPFVLLWDGDEYRHSTLSRRYNHLSETNAYAPPSMGNTFLSVRLPDGTPALAVLDRVGLSDYYAELSGMGKGSRLCPAADEPSVPLEVLSLAQESHEFQHLMSVDVCETDSLPELLAGGSFEAWYWYQHSEGLVTYTWNAESGTFEPPSPMPTPALSNLNGILHDAAFEYDGGRFDEALAHIQSLEEGADGVEVLYLRAMVLEALGQDSATLRLYETLSADEPESVLGRLAALRIR
ncbi:MAG: hypothetical protein MUF38_07095 [Anaerolineae bacterium]|jgi:tetratricopeptide (TPR) repeat protein|nr:hypothetical protein [Anaerolineae bacterium]